MSLRHICEYCTLLMKTGNKGTVLTPSQKESTGLCIGYVDSGIVSFSHWSESVFACMSDCIVS